MFEDMNLKDVYLLVESTLKSSMLITENLNPSKIVLLYENIVWQTLANVNLNIYSSIYVQAQVNLF